MMVMMMLMMIMLMMVMMIDGDDDDDDDKDKDRSCLDGDNGGSEISDGSGKLVMLMKMLKVCW